MRVGEVSKKGYAREDLVDVWARYVTDAEARDTHSSKRIPTELVGIEIPLSSSDFGVTSVTEVTGVTLDDRLPDYDDSDPLCDDDYQSDDEKVAMIERAFSV